MSLFTRLLTSLYPEDLLNQPGSPAGMFLGMISPQSFFNVITKKMAENYKLNHFDVALDPFEVKIGFGEQSMIKPKAMQSYYSYCAAANLNGYQFYTIGALATNIVIMASHFLRPIVSKYSNYYGYLTHLLFALYAVSHLFATGIKQFPRKDNNKSYQWFVDVWFGYFELILSHQEYEYDPLIVADIKSSVSAEIELCFGLYRMMKRINTLLTTKLDRNYLKRLCDHEITKHSQLDQGQIIDHIINHSDTSDLSEEDYVLMQMILPHDFTVKYFFGQQDIYNTIDYIVDNLYDWDVVGGYLTQSMDDDLTIVDLITYLCDHHHLKENFFHGVKDFIMQEIREDEDQEELEEFMSMIGSGMIGNIPEQLRRESAVTERLMNFYLNHIGSMRVARGDTFELMLTPKIAQYIQSIHHDQHPNSYELDLYRHYLSQYTVNTSYYHYVYEGVRSGKASFTLPYIIEADEVYAHMSMIDLVIQSSMTSILQDTLSKEIKLYPQSDTLISLFKQQYGKRITQSLSASSKKLIQYIVPTIPDSLRKLLTTPQMIAHIKESLYTIDLHCYHDVVEELINHPTFKAKYQEHATILIMGTLRETLYGVMCLMAMIHQQSKYSGPKSDNMLQFLLSSYVIHVVGMQDAATMIICFDIIFKVYTQISELLDNVIRLDDNEEFMMMGIEFMHRFLKDKEDAIKAHQDLLKEDIVWLRGYLKHINYYNKRYFIPQ